jgi:UDPglucose 6-dehydrogenase
MGLNVTVIGTGYVGLVSGTCFAEQGFQVTCVDVDAEKIRKLSEENEIPIYEPGLEEMVKRNVEVGRLQFTTDLSTCVPKADCVLIAVGTPQGEDGSADLQYVLHAASDIAKHLDGYTVVINKSTVPVGTGVLVTEKIEKVNPKADFDVASNPEFLREGAAIEDSMKPDRIVVGVTGEKPKKLLQALYKPWTDNGVPLLITNRETSELIKYASNAFLATKITFINEMATLCEQAGADVEMVAEGMGLDSRIGEKFLNAGPGYGGSCFPKDTAALAKTARDFDTVSHIVETVITTNTEIKKRMAEKVITACGGDVKDKKIAVLGLAFKAETDDMRDAPALTIIPVLQKAGATVFAYDPEAMTQSEKLLPSINYRESTQDVCENADAVVIMTEWDVFKQLNLTTLKEWMKGDVLVDLRNIFDAEEANKNGFNYTRIGHKATALQQQKVA